jgi:hypothetical protein
MWFSLGGGSLALTCRKGLPFGKVVHKISTLDAQPAGQSGDIIVLVTGVLLVSRHLMD